MALRNKQVKTNDARWNSAQREPTLSLRKPEAEQQDAVHSDTQTMGQMMRLNVAIAHNNTIKRRRTML